MRISRLLACLIALLALAPAARAQLTCGSNYAPPFSSGGSVFGYTADQWSSFLGGKVDINGGSLCNPTITNPTFTSPLSILSPFVLGGITVTTSGTQFNLLNQTTGSTGLPNTNLVFSSSPVLANPSLTGTPIAPTAPIGTATQQIATTAFVQAAVVGAGVTSVGLAAPSWLTVTGSPVTTAGTLTLSATSGLVQNQFLGTPDGTPGPVGLRALGMDDLPPQLANTVQGNAGAGVIQALTMPSCSGATNALIWTTGTGFGCNTITGGGGGGTVTSVAMTVGPAWLTVSGSPITSTGTLAVNATTGQTANEFVATPDGSAGAVGLRAMSLNDLPTGTANEILGYAAAGGVQQLPIPSCNGASSALQWTSSVGFGCALISGSGGSWVPPGSIDATTVSGSDMCAKISAAQPILDAAHPLGGVIDARGFTGTNHCNGSMFAGWNSDRGFDVLLGPVIIQTNVPQCTPSYDSMIGYTQYPNFGSSTGTIIQASSSYSSTSGAFPTVSGSSGSTTITVSSASGISFGDYVTATGVAPHAKVMSISGTTIGLSQVNTGTVSGSSTFMPAVVCMGNVPNVNTYHTHIINIAASCQTGSAGGSIPVGCVVFQDLWAQEGSYFRNTYAGIGQEQYDLEFLTNVNPQNIAPWQDLYAQQLVATTGLDLPNATCLQIGNSQNLLQVSGEIQKASCAGTAGTTKALAILDGVSGFTISDSHFENAIGGYQIGPHRRSHGVVLENDSCGTGISGICAELMTGGGSDGVSIFGLQGSTTNTAILQDDQSGGCTLTPSSVGTSFTAVTYIRGGNGTSPVIKGMYSGC